MLFASCGDASIDEPYSEVFQEAEESAYFYYHPKHNDTKVDDTYNPAIDQLEREKENDIFPFLPETLELDQPLPTHYSLSGNFDTSRNNQTFNSMSFYIDDALFEYVETEHKYFARFDPALDSEVGPFVVTLLAEPFHYLHFFVTDADGILDQVWTLNNSMHSFMTRYRPRQVYSYFSATVEGRYLPAAMFVTDDTAGMIFWVTDVEHAQVEVDGYGYASSGYVYSIQFLSFDSNYNTAQQHQVIFDFINSIRFS